MTGRGKSVESCRLPARCVGCLRTDDLYVWPGGVARALGLGRVLYELVRACGLRPRGFGRKRFVRGAQVLESLEIYWQRGDADVQGVDRDQAFAPGVKEEYARVEKA